MRISGHFKWTFLRGRFTIQNIYGKHWSLTFTKANKCETSFLVVLLPTRGNKNMITEDPALTSKKHSVGVTSLSKGSCLLPASWILPLPSSSPAKTFSPSCLNLPPAPHPPRPSRPHTLSRGEEGGHGRVQHRLVRHHLLAPQASWLHFLRTRNQNWNILSKLDCIWSICVMH